MFLQRPLSVQAASQPATKSVSCRRLGEGDWLMLALHSLLSTLAHLLRLYALTLCGPLRTCLVGEQPDIAIVAIVGVVLSIGAGSKSGSSPTRLRGAVLFGMAIVALLVLDNDGAVDATAATVDTPHPEGQQHSGVSHLFYYLMAWMGIADHKSGVVLLCIVVLMQVGVNALGRRVASEVGGAKRMHALSTTLSGLILIPWAVILWLGASEQEGGSYLVVLYVAAFSFVANFYIESFCSQRLDLPLSGRISSISVILIALALSLWWQQWPDGVTEVADHGLSGGVVFSCLMFICAVLSLTSQGRSGSKGSFVGYSAQGLPLYNFTSDALQQTSQSLANFTRSALKQVLANSNSRRIFYFLCLNLAFTFVEFIYGFWTNSLGLISDGFHMLFDCSALVLGLFAAVMARWKPSKTFPFGYGRVEVLSGFVNGLFLLVVSVCVFWEGLARLWDPPEVDTTRLLAVSVAGLCVNLVGIAAFRHSNHQHGHSHHGHSHNINMEGVFLHMVADTLGSVGVIVSSVAIQQMGWLWADPVCSLFIASLIFCSVVPLLRESSLVLLLRSPVIGDNKVEGALQAACQLQGISGWRQPRFWTHSQDVLCGSLHAQLTPDACEQKIIRQVAALFQPLGFSNFTVQAEKEEFFTHLSGLGSHHQHEGVQFRSGAQVGPGGKQMAAAASAILSNSV